MINTAVESQFFKEKNIYQKTPAEKMKLKTISQHLSVPFMNETIIHINADNLPTEIVRKKQPSAGQKRKNKF